MMDDNCYQTKEVFDTEDDYLYRKQKQMKKAITNIERRFKPDKDGVIDKSGYFTPKERRIMKKFNKKRRLPRR